MHIAHHGAVRGVTGSCHQLGLDDGRSVLIDCGLFQGAETSPDGAGPDQLEIRFPLDGVQALVVTHVHIDHVGRVPHLLAAGFSGPIVCSQASAELLPMVLEDALEVGFTRDRALIGRVMAQLRRQIVPLPYKQWHVLVAPPAGAGGPPPLRLRLQPAGHILGSAYVEFDLSEPGAQGSTTTQRVVFSGDLGAPYTPLLPAPVSPAAADVVVMESTYGDRLHEGRKDRRQRLQAMCEHAFGNGGTVLIPAFSIGRTQELLCELEDIIHRHRGRPAAGGIDWSRITIVVDSPLAADFTEGYSKLKAHWDAEARTQLRGGAASAGLRAAEDGGPARAAPAHRRAPGAQRRAGDRDRGQRHVQRRAHRQLPQGDAGRPAARHPVLRLPGRRHAGPGDPDAWPARRLGGAGRRAHRDPRARCTRWAATRPMRTSATC